VQGEGAGLYVMDNCPAFIETVPMIPRDEDDPDDVDTNSIDHCFIAGTMIRTPDGERPIEDLRTGDMVETRFGAFPIIDTHVTENQKVITNSGLTGTPGHKVWTYQGIKHLDSLTRWDMLHTWQIQKNANRLNLTVSLFDDTPIHPGEKLGYISCLLALIERTVSEDYTKRFTDIFTGQFLKVITSITKTETLSTMTRRTLKQLRQKNTSDCTFLSELNSCENTRQEFAHSLRLGMGAQKVRNGIQSISREHLKRWNLSVSHAINAKPSSGQNQSGDTNSAQASAEPDTATCQELTTSKGNVNFAENASQSTSIQKTRHAPGHAVENTRRETVINLTVAGPNDYFANGVLVLNCYDEVRYMVLEDKPLFASKIDIDFAM
jgi:hypothetical protein